jgi:hypothetical protein
MVLVTILYSNVLCLISGWKLSFVHLRSKTLDMSSILSMKFFGLSTFFSINIIITIINKTKLFGVLIHYPCSIYPSIFLFK